MPADQVVVPAGQMVQYGIGIYAIGVLGWVSAALAGKLLNSRRQNGSENTIENALSQIAHAISQQTFLIGQQSNMLERFDKRLDEIWKNTVHRGQ